MFSQFWVWWWWWWLRLLLLLLLLLFIVVVDSGFQREECASGNILTYWFTREGDSRFKEENHYEKCYQG